MECRRCHLNISSENFRPEMLRKLPVKIRQIFVCEKADKRSFSDKSPGRAKLCVKDLWVLAFIGKNDRFACEEAVDTLDTLVVGGHSELLCNLFETAPYHIRRTLWLRMTNVHSQRLYLFDSLFEKYSLAPLEKDQQPDDLHVYQHQMLFSANSARPLPEGL